MKNNAEFKLALACNLADRRQAENKRLRSFGKKIGFPLWQCFETVDYRDEMIEYETAMLKAIEKLPKPEWFERAQAQYNSWE